jgi:hypothetical protein
MKNRKKIMFYALILTASGYLGLSVYRLFGKAALPVGRRVEATNGSLILEAFESRVIRTPEGLLMATDEAVALGANQRQLYTPLTAGMFLPCVPYVENIGTSDAFVLCQVSLTYPGTVPDEVRKFINALYCSTLTGIDFQQYALVDPSDGWSLVPVQGDDEEPMKLSDYITIKENTLSVVFKYKPVVKPKDKTVPVFTGVRIPPNLTAEHVKYFESCVLRLEFGGVQTSSLSYILTGTSAKHALGWD